MHKKVLALVVGFAIYYVANFLQFLNGLAYFLFYGDSSETLPFLVIFSLFINLSTFLIPFIAAGWYQFRRTKSWLIVILGVLINLSFLVGLRYVDYNISVGRQSARVTPYEVKKASFSQFLLESTLPTLGIEGVFNDPVDIEYKQAQSLETPPLPTAYRWKPTTEINFGPVTLPYTVETKSKSDGSNRKNLIVTGTIWSAQVPATVPTLTMAQAYQKSLMAQGWLNGASVPYYSNIGFLLNHIKTSNGLGDCPKHTSSLSPTIGVKDGKMRLVLVTTKDPMNCTAREAGETSYSSGPSRPDHTFYIFISEVVDISEILKLGSR